MWVISFVDKQWKHCLSPKMLNENHKGAKLFISINIWIYFFEWKINPPANGKHLTTIRSTWMWIGGRAWEHSIAWVNCGIIFISSGRIERNWAYNSYLITFNLCCKWLTLSTCRSNAVNNFHDFVVFDSIAESHRERNWHKFTGCVYIIEWIILKVDRLTRIIVHKTKALAIGWHLLFQASSCWAIMKMLIILRILILVGWARTFWEISILLWGFLSHSQANRNV